MEKMIEVAVTHTLEYTEHYVISEKAYNKILKKGDTHHGEMSYSIQEQGEEQAPYGVYGEINEWLEPRIIEED